MRGSSAWPSSQTCLRSRISRRSPEQWHNAPDRDVVVLRVSSMGVDADIPDWQELRDPLSLASQQVGQAGTHHLSLPLAFLLPDAQLESLLDAVVLESTVEEQFHVSRIRRHAAVDRERRKIAGMYCKIQSEENTSAQPVNNNPTRRRELTLQVLAKPNRHHQARLLQLQR